MTHYVALVSCGARKLAVSAPAERLYTSDLFQASAAVARRLDPALDGDSPWFVVSAKHGLVKPDVTLAPYDVSLASLTAVERSSWAQLIAQELASTYRPADTVVCLFAGAQYSRYLTSALHAAGFATADLLKGLTLGVRLKRLKGPLPSGVAWAQLEGLYDELNRLCRAGYGPHPIEVSAMRWPARGVYFFVQDGEHRGGQKAPRVIRVGTHGVSIGSGSTLWKRIKTHQGDGAGGGSHRSSVFRYHIGTSLLRESQQRLPEWGAALPRGVRPSDEERLMERRVSETIRGMNVVVLPVGDEASARSDRAFIERSAISLLANAGRLLDPPSSHWRGLAADREQIRMSGVWNVDHINANVSRDFLPTMHHLVDNAIRDDVSLKSLAPLGWWAERRDSTRLF